MNQQNRNYGGARPQQTRNQGSQSGYSKQFAKPKLPEKYLQGGYFDEKGNKRKELYLDWAMEIAENLRIAKMTPNALRRYYNQIKNIASIVNGKEQLFEERKSELFRLQALVFNASKKNDSSTPELMNEFIDINIKQAEQSLKCLQAFVEHFECVVAYFKERER